MADSYSSTTAAVASSSRSHTAPTLPSPCPIFASRPVPHRVFIVRHGERLDKVSPEGWWASLGTDRLHDSPLTDHGKFQGRQFGMHVLRRLAEEKSSSGRGGTATATTPSTATVRNHQQQYQQQANNNRGKKKKQQHQHITILASPLQRCVETAHEICRVLHEAAAAATPDDDDDDQQRLSVSPLCIEPSLIESTGAMNTCLKMEQTTLVTLHRPHAHILMPSMKKNQFIWPSTAIARDAETLKALGLSSFIDPSYRPLASVTHYLYDNPKAASAPPRVLQKEENGCYGNAERAMAELLNRCGGNGVSDDGSDEATDQQEDEEEEMSTTEHVMILVGHGDSIVAWYRLLAQDKTAPFPRPFNFTCNVELDLHHSVQQTRTLPSSTTMAPLPKYKLSGGYFQIPHLERTLGGSIDALMSRMAKKKPKLESKRKTLDDDDEDNDVLLISGSIKNRKNNATASGKVICVVEDDEGGA